MVGGVDEDEVVPLLFREGAEVGMRERRGRHALEGGGLGTELVDGGGLVVTGAGKPPVWHLDARLHPSLTQNSLEDQRADDSANDPGPLMGRAAHGRADALADMFQRLRQVP